jgi:lipid A 3-O-deacylase
MKKCIASIALLFASLIASAQKPAETGLISDNDLYTSPTNDRYYTNGLELFYRYLGTRQTEKLAKNITEFRIGQYIYNPQSPDVEDVIYHDRPFAGYLFAEAGINKFYRNQDVLKVSLQAGVVGPESLAEETQEFIHNVFGYDPVRGWGYQIKTAYSVQVNAFYSKKIFPDRYKEKIDFHLQGGINIGTIWMSASVGPMARISFKRSLLPVYDSALHGALLNHNKELYKEQKEFFLYLNPSISYMAYDATIQGSMFNDESPVTFPLIPFRFNAEAGIKYRNNNWNLSYSFNYRGKELTNNVIVGYFYGSVAVGYLL